jgi:hypothetical protein
MHGHYRYQTKQTALTHTPLAYMTLLEPMTRFVFELRKSIASVEGRVDLTVRSRQTRSLQRLIRA